MNRKLLKFTSVGALAMALVAYGCDNLSEPTSPLAAGDRSEQLIIEKRGGYTIARETDPEVGVVSAVIDDKGGSLNIGAHTLTVPKKAVDGPTTFTLTKLPGEIKVGLTATRILPNDVGHAGFKRPVTLSLSYARGEPVPNESALKIFWIRPDGTKEEQPSHVDKKDRAVEASLRHFSDYGIGFPNQGGGDDW